ncbi:1,4-alpha-glucan branching protein GlgB [Marivivens donghaensis]|uniref:1,4-alpha-glucan branching enzyme GlgB n=1 Tax=Marivivens donghaensis TaxID=1699413 RepID=A0ABX0VTK1_9RHOB|nr:1,4-alpha-glucan branching protein GlgB [Marivivens donghaensis]NIY71347.1 1,4-alpha-glucan branching protein GlgB [Marivivens donghaensis]
MTAEPFLSGEILDALNSGHCADNFQYLGPRGRGPDRYVTAIAPDTASLDALVDGQVYPLERLGGGVYGGKVPGDARYKLRADDGFGNRWEYDDAYSFGPVLSGEDDYYFGEGKHRRLWKILGAHTIVHEYVEGTHFAVWAPNAKRVSIIGDFNNWDNRRHVLRRRGNSGVWEIFIPAAHDGQRYKYDIIGAEGERHLKADPVGFGAQHAPETASIIRDLGGYGWRDAGWMETRAEAQNRNAPISIYEVHLGSWRRVVDDGNRPLSYKEAAEQLVGYVKDLGFTHIEFLPLSEYPFEGSWGYQPVGMYAPTIRFGPPHEFRDLVDAAHTAGIGIIIDWVPAHFPTDPHGLAKFDGTSLYEHADPKEGFHQDWNTLIYNYGRREVSNYLISNALYWLEEYHIDGLRVDAVASMLYRDYSRRDGEWIPNKDGGRENYEAIDMLRHMNSVTYGEFAGIMTVAEESTSFPKVSAPVDHGGLGFGFKWNMGWMNDTLRYMELDPVHRKHHHSLMTFGLHYAYSENFVLPISHDEVVHGKGSMIEKMPGDEWQKFANLRAYYGFMWTHPGKKLMFMGNEFAQWREWNHDRQLDWDLLGDHKHAGIQNLVRDLNNLYQGTPALHVNDSSPEGFDWVDGGNTEQSVFTYLRRGNTDDAVALVALNMTPIERGDYRIGVPSGGFWREAMNTDSERYGGANVGNFGGVEAEDISAHGHQHSIRVTLPALSAVIFVAGNNE